MKPHPRWVFIVVATVMILMTVVSIGLPWRNSASPYLLFWLAITYWSFKRDDVKLHWWLKQISLLNAAGLILLLVMHSPDSLSFLNINSHIDILIAAGVPLSVKLALLFVLHKEQGGSMATFFDIFRSGYEHRLRNGGGANTFQNVSGSPLSELEVTPDLEDQISFEFWKRAADEYETARDEAHWAKAFAISEGDDAKTKATYIRIRAITLFRLAEEDRKSNDTFIQKPEPVHVIPRRSSEFFVATIALAIVVIAVATIWLIVDSRKSKSGQEFSSVAGNTMPNTSTAVSGKTGSVCRVYWDGFQIRPEKNNMRGYAEYRLEFYGNEIRLALPKELATELHGTLAPGDSPNFNAFFNSIEQQIISACGISF